MNYSEKYKKIIDALVEYDFEKKPATLSDFLKEKIFTKDIGIQLVAPNCTNDVIAYFDDKVNSSDHFLFDVLEVFSILQDLKEQKYIFIIPITDPLKSFEVCSYNEELATSIKDCKYTEDGFMRINSNERIYVGHDGSWVDNNYNSLYAKIRIPSYSFPIKEFLHSTVIKTKELELLKKNKYKSESIRLNITAQTLMVISIFVALIAPIDSYCQFNCCINLLIKSLIILLVYLYFKY